MTKYIATQHGRENIRCNAIMPGLILDPELEPKIAELAALIKRHQLIERTGRPEDIAALAAFFASDESGFITGQSLRADGGVLDHQPMFADELDRQSN